MPRLGSNSFDIFQRLIAARCRSHGENNRVLCCAAQQRFCGVVAGALPYKITSPGDTPFMSQSIDMPVRGGAESRLQNESLLETYRRVACALEQGLRSLGVPIDDPALIEARDFVSRCQTPDGSFVYSPVELALNKGHRAENGDPRGYGSATCDGILALYALGIGDSDPAERALDWLRTNHRVDANPGVVGGPMEPFAQAMRGYYRAGAATCFAEAGGPAGWRAELIATVVAEQREDGSWLNENPLQKENDPLIATAFALTALLEAR